jgi:hypothetical protein
MRARLNETTASGSYPAFKTNVRIRILSKNPKRLSGISYALPIRSGYQKTRHQTW